MVAVLALAAWEGSHFIWQRLRPASTVALHEFEKDPRQVAVQLSASGIFGGTGDKDAARSERGGGDDLRLVGVAAGGGMALIAVDGRQALWFHVGSEVIPGVRLIEVLARQVKIERIGRSETLMLPEEKWKK
ncbi:MAG: hypothetical protein KUL88_06980 [Rhizobium sp.]|nr:hypothetical protein [Rhizobium sp.]